MVKPYLSSVYRTTHTKFGKRKLQLFFCRAVRYCYYLGVCAKSLSFFNLDNSQSSQNRDGAKKTQVPNFLLYSSSSFSPFFSPYRLLELNLYSYTEQQQFPMSRHSWLCTGTWRVLPTTIWRVACQPYQAGGTNIAAVRMTKQYW